jgi:type IV fimbrial biogenesis protein FimT
VLSKPADVLMRPVDVMSKPVDVLMKPVDVLSKPVDVLMKPVDVLSKPVDVLMKPARRTAGFTLIEMVVAIGIFALLVALTVPTMQVWIANTKVRAVADALQNGVRLAQAESLRRSRQVVFALTTNTAPQPGTFTAVANGTYWAIQTIPAMTDGSEQPVVVNTGVLTSAGSNVTITGQAAICFNSVGRLIVNTATATGVGAACTVPAAGVNSSTVPTLNYKINLTKTDGTALADHPLQVEVALGGQVHLCDPTQTLSNSNPYGC